MNHFETELSRRTLFRQAALGGAVAALGGAMLAQSASAQAEASTAPAAPPAPSPKALSDLEIANFALSLERLEASFYSQVLAAHEKRAFLTGRMPEMAREIASNENAHVQALEQAITAGGGTPTGAASYKFPNNVFISPVAFTWFGHTLEEIGIGAYLGAIGQINSSTLRRAAASIYGAETRHAAILRSLGGFTFSPRYFESPLSVAQVQGLVAPYLA